MKPYTKKFFSVAGLIGSIILINLAGCVNSPEQIAKLGNEALNDSISYYQVKFDESYEKAKNQNKDNSKMLKLKTDIMRFGDYVTTKINIIKPVKDPSADVSNIKEMFVEMHLGDSIYYKLKDIYSEADSCANSLKAKDYISQSMSSVFTDQSAEAWTTSIFSLNSSTGTTWFLKGIQMEIYKIGALVLSDYVPN